METIPLFLAIFVGFAHAFEADHLVAVSTIVTRRNNMGLAIKDGVFWGLGHSSTILLVGCIFLLGSYRFNISSFTYLEGCVGVMLMVLGVYRLVRLGNSALDHRQAHRHGQAHEHKLAYGVGLVHGLAGSGALILSVLTTIKSPVAGLAYLVVFGAGSIAGMMLAAGLFSVPFSERILKSQTLRNGLVVVSALLCIFLGGKVVYESFVNGQ